jgi:acyl-CoA thioesterase I
MKRAMALVGMMSVFFAHSVPAPSMKRILILGDSLSEGLGLKPNQAYPALLTDKLRADGLNYEILNASQSGGTTEGGLRRLPPHLPPKADKSDIFILELGINDAFRGVPIEQIRANLQEIIDRVKRANPHVRLVICGMQLPNFGGDDYVSTFGQLYVDLASKNNAALVPYLLQGVAGDPALNQADRLHPNAAGQRVLANNVWRVLEPIVRDVASSTSSTSH